MRIICVILFLGGNILEWSFYFKLIIVSYFRICARGTMPRYHER